MTQNETAPWIPGAVDERPRRLRTYAVNLVDAHPACLPEDVYVAAEGARKAIEVAASRLGAPPHRCFAIRFRGDLPDGADVMGAIGFKEHGFRAPGFAPGFALARVPEGVAPHT